VTSHYDAIQAVSNGADRLLVCSALEMGGLTPTSEVLRHVQEIASREASLRKRTIPVTVMIRPRAGGFYYDPAEFGLMRDEATRLLELGADGIAFGILDRPSPRPLPDGRPDVRIDSSRSQELVALAHARGKQATFNRAFDLLPDRQTGLHELIRIGCDRVLTSGGWALALDGASALAADVQFAGWEIEVVAAGAITPETIGAVVGESGCNTVLGELRREMSDHSLPQTHPIAASLGSNNGHYSVTDGGLVGQAAAALRTMERDADTEAE
jgi:copper homeostasis protein